MKYYHVNQGFTSVEPMLGIHASTPAKAAGAYFRMLALMDAKLVFPWIGGVTARASCTAADWADLHFGGCFVEDRQAKKTWSVSVSDSGKLNVYQELPPPKKAKK